LKKPAGSVRFRFYEQKTEKTEPNRTEPKPTKNRKKNRAKPEKPSQTEKTEPKPEKPSQTGLNRFLPLKNRTELNRNQSV